MNQEQVLRGDLGREAAIEPDGVIQRPHHRAQPVGLLDVGAAGDMTQHVCVGEEDEAHGFILGFSVCHRTLTLLSCQRTMTSRGFHVYPNAR